MINLLKPMVDVSYKKLMIYEKVFPQRPNIIEDISKCHYTIDQPLFLLHDPGY